jgi:hypothetical protein
LSAGLSCSFDHPDNVREVLVGQFPQWNLPAVFGRPELDRMARLDRLAADAEPRAASNRRADRRVVETDL